ncbi:hypothetical protein AA0111_g11663 [Alternaria arborescens]|uniref:hypothetical protein n=1 Tax=Alternaria arborescens TaxID=156630 RepID=UPI0010752D46|nr:hypothetical protein AA0111_g11663 [Alternaria arborescens]RYO15437.1 hypothetical protein AA0111_g11663 [Alternaria arborescens]
MVHFKPTSVLFAVAALITKNVVAEEAHALEVFPELKGTGPFEIAYKDPETNKVVVEHVDEHGESTLEKRTYQVNQDVVAKLLRNHNGYGFCKGFCPAYQPQKPVTQTNLKTFTKVVTVTSSVVPAPATVTLTATGQAPADSTVVQTTTISETATTTVTDAPTTVSDVQTITITSAATTVLTQSTTLNFPSAPTLKARHVNPPSWLKGVANNLICPACTKVWPAPPAKTVSVCKTTTVTRTQTQTATAARATATTTVSVTPTAKTVTAVISMTLTLTDSTTVTPIVTETSTATTTVTTTITSTTTQTLCPQQTADVYGIQAVQPGTLKTGPSGKTATECCLACFSDPDGCTQWWAYTNANYCMYSVPKSGLGAPSELCPNGKGNGALFVGAVGSNPGGFGGPGQCAA